MYLRSRNRLDAPIGTNESPEEILLRYRLAERNDSGLRLTLAALLLFGRDPQRWHPRCGIDLVKYDGTERRSGEQLNIVKRERMDTSDLIALLDGVNGVSHVVLHNPVIDVTLSPREIATLGDVTLTIEGVR